MTRIALDELRFYLNRHLQWMAFDQRIEVPVSVEGAQLQERICKEILPAHLLDNRKARAGA